MIETLRKRTWFNISDLFEKSDLSWILGDKAGRGRILGGFSRASEGFHGQGSSWFEGVPWPELGGFMVSMVEAPAHVLHGHGSMGHVYIKAGKTP